MQKTQSKPLIGTKYRTPLGRFLAKKRIDDEDKQADMAEHLGVSPAYLSAIEGGKKPLSDTFARKVLDAYGKDEALCDAIKQTKREEVEADYQSFVYTLFVA